MPLSSSPLDWSSDRREALGHAVLEWVLRWYDETGQRRLYPDVSAATLERRLSAALPLEPQDPTTVLAEFAADIANASRDNGHPRMFGYVQSGGTFAGALADFLASALNQNVTSWRSSPAATTLERQVIAWIAEIVGFEGDGLLVSGGSMANFVAVVAATVAAHPDAARGGIRALPGNPVVYATALVHLSIPKAVAMAGLGRDAVRHVAMDANGRRDTAALDRAIAADRDAGRTRSVLLRTPET